MKTMQLGTSRESSEKEVTRIPTASGRLALQQLKACGDGALVIHLSRQLSSDQVLGVLQASGVAVNEVHNYRNLVTDTMTHFDLARGLDAVHLSDCLPQIYVVDRVSLLWGNKYWFEHCNSPTMRVIDADLNVHYAREVFCHIVTITAQPDWKNNTSCRVYELLRACSDIMSFIEAKGGDEFLQLYAAQLAYRAAQELYAIANMYEVRQQVPMSPGVGSLETAMRTIQEVLRLRDGEFPAVGSPVFNNLPSMKVLPLIDATLRVVENIPELGVPNLSRLKFKCTTW